MHSIIMYIAEQQTVLIPSRFNSIRGSQAGFYGDSLPTSAESMFLAADGSNYRRSGFPWPMGVLWRVVIWSPQDQVPYV